MLSSVNVSPTKKVPQTPITRLVVSQIVVENFKSYAGSHVIGPFHKSFTSIVGPNGSGKSNVIDAFMFVLGYRAKKLRQSKLSDLIHVSAETDHLNIESCSVEVHFEQILDYGETFETIEGSGIVVGRQAWRNGRNQYYVNGQASTFADVASLLKSHGLDLDHKRFLILQGEVESIAQMKAKASNEHEEGLLEYLEDIIGSNQYIEPIEAASKQLNELTEKCQEKGLRTRVAEKECQSLTAEKDAAIKYVKYENELAMRKADLFQAMLYRSRMNISKVEKELNNAEDRLEKLQVKQGTDNEELLKLEADVKAKHMIVQNADKEAAKISARITDIERLDVQCKARRDELKRRLNALQKTSKEDQKARADAERELTNINGELEALEQNSEELKSSLEVAEKELEKICDSLRPATEDLQHHTLHQ